MRDLVWGILGSGPIALSLAWKLYTGSPEGYIVVKDPLVEKVREVLKGLGTVIPIIPLSRLGDNLRLFSAPLKIIALKAYHLKKLRKTELDWISQGIVLLGMNGLRVLDELRELSSLKSPSQISQLVIEYGARFEEGTLRVEGEVKAFILDEVYQRLPEPLRSMDLWIPLDRDSYRRKLLVKAGINAIVNTLTVLLEAPNRQLFSYPALLKKLSEEVAGILSTELEISPDDFREALYRVIGNTGDNISSSLQDYLEGKDLELSWFTGALLEISEKENLRRLYRGALLKHQLRKAILKALGLRQA